MWSFFCGLDEKRSNAIERLISKQIACKQLHGKRNVVSNQLSRQLEDTHLRNSIEVKCTEDEKQKELFPFDGRPWRQSGAGGNKQIINCRLLKSFVYSWLLFWPHSRREKTSVSLVKRSKIQQTAANKCDHNHATCPKIGTCSEERQVPPWETLFLTRTIAVTLATALIVGLAHLFHSIL